MLFPMQKVCSLEGILLLVTVLFLVTPSAAQRDTLYQAQSEFGDSLSCDYLASGIFLVWWDKTNDLSIQASILLDSMAVYRGISLNSLEMQDPPNPQNGYYFNIYLHEFGDVFPDGWSCGVGTDSYGYPYMTLPIGVLNDWITISHEAFHVFQYSCDTPGFSQNDCFWYIEGSASWFAATTYSEDPNAFVEAESLVRIPHVPMWLGYDNFPSYYPENWQRYVHQYAMALFLFYLTEVRDVPYLHISGGFYNDSSSTPQNLLPQEYLYEAFNTIDLRTYFIDWAAHMTNDFDFILPSQRAMAELHWNSYADPEDDNQYTMVYNQSGFGECFRPPDSLATTAWSFNTYKVLNSNSNPFTFNLMGDLTGSLGDPAYFRGKILVKNALNGTRFYDLAMQGNTTGSLTVEVTPADTALYFIVASMPEVFTGVDQVFQYFINIEKGSTSVESPVEYPGILHLGQNSPNPFSTTTAIEYGIPIAGSVRLSVFDVHGRLVTTLIDDELAAGWHETEWDGRDESGIFLPGGVYIAHLESSGQVTNTAITLLR